jgi:RNA polymerase sigma-70 factor (ECF subfamily)
LQRIRAGEPEALGDLARIYREPLVHALRRTMRLSPSDAEEAVQEVWRILVADPAKIARFVPNEHGARFRSFLFAFARNVARNMSRKMRPDPLPDGFDAAEDSELEEELGRSEGRRLLAYLVKVSADTTPERRTQREAASALLLFYARKRSYREVAERLKISIERVKYLLEAGRKLAREGLKNFVLEDGLSPQDCDGLYQRFIDRLDDLLEDASRASA